MQIYIILFENQAIMSNSTELKFGLCTFSQKRETWMGRGVK